MTDETSKFGRKYCTYIVSDAEDNSYLLGLREMSNKSAKTTLDTFKEILEDISETCKDYEKMTSVGYMIQSNIRDTMSDRAATDKAFNHLLEEYRISTLPMVIENWDRMTTDKQKSVSKMQNFFCALHLLVGMADTCSAGLLKFENLSKEDWEESAFGSGTVNLIRMTAKALSRGGDEKNGCYQDWRVYIEGKKEKVLFINFKGNRVNVLFYIAEVTFYHWESVKEFLLSVRGTTNELLRSIIKFMESEVYHSCCRVLGLLAKLVTSPFWRLAEETTHVLDLNDHYTRLHEFLKDNAEAPIPSLLLGESPFPDS